MANMSYCRFENTLRDLEDCFKHLSDEDLSKSEQKAKEQLIELCQRIASGEIEEDNEEFEEPEDLRCYVNQDFLPLETAV